MAVCDAHYVFTLVNIGDFGSNNDGDILQNPAMGGALESITLGIQTQNPLGDFRILSLIIQCGMTYFV